MLSALYAIARLSVTRVDQTKMVEVRIVKFSPYGTGRLWRSAEQLAVASLM